MPDDLKGDLVPDNFANLVVEKYRGYGLSEGHHKAFRYFATRILPSVNASFTKFERLRVKKTISECFSYTDEAFALLMVLNYEPRWLSQHKAKVEHPNRSRRTREQLWKDARFTSSTEGNRRGQSWTKEGLLRFNNLCTMVKAQREVEETGDTVEKDLRDWCREEAGMTPLGKTTEMVAPDPQDEEDEEEVEAMGECDIYQV
jgi:hypothetical protein